MLQTKLGLLFGNLFRQVAIELDYRIGSAATRLRNFIKRTSRTSKPIIKCLRSVNTCHERINVKHVIDAIPNAFGLLCYVGKLGTDGNKTQSPTDNGDKENCPFQTLNGPSSSANRNTKRFSRRRQRGKHGNTNTQSIQTGSQNTKNNSKTPDEINVVNDYLGKVRHKYCKNSNGLNKIYKCTANALGVLRKCHEQRHNLLHSRTEDRANSLNKRNQRSGKVRNRRQHCRTKNLLHGRKRSPQRILRYPKITRLTLISAHRVTSTLIQQLQSNLLINKTLTGTLQTIKTSSSFFRINFGLLHGDTELFDRVILATEQRGHCKQRLLHVVTERQRKVSGQTGQTLSLFGNLVHRETGLLQHRTNKRRSLSGLSHRQTNTISRLSELHHLRCKRAKHRLQTIQVRLKITTSLNRITRKVSNKLPTLKRGKTNGSLSGSIRESS